MRTLKLTKLAPMLIVMGFLAFAAYSIESATAVPSIAPAPVPAAAKSATTPPSPLVVARVLPMEVVLRAGGKDHVLAYSDKLGKPAGTGVARRSSPPDGTSPGPDLDAGDLDSQLRQILSMFGPNLSAQGLLN